MDLVDVLRLDPGLDHETVVARHDFHQRLAGPDHAADRVNDGLMDHAGLRRAHVNARELVFRRDQALAQLGDLTVDLGQLATDLAGQVLVDLDQLQLGFGDRGTSLRHRNQQPAVLTLDPCHLALERGQLAHRHQALLPEFAGAGQLARDQLDLVGLGLGLDFDAAD